MLSDALNFLRELKGKLPKWAKIIAIVVITLLSVVFFFTSCGASTKVTARTSEGSTLNITIDNNSEIKSDTDVSPNVDLPVRVKRISPNSYDVRIVPSSFNSFITMFQECKFNPAIDLKETEQGKAVDLAQSIENYSVTDASPIITNGMESPDDVGTRIRDNFDAYDRMPEAVSMSLGANEGMGYAGSEANS